VSLTGPSGRAAHVADGASTGAGMTWVRAVALLMLAGGTAVTGFWRLGVDTWHTDESLYASTGWAYTHGDLTANWEHPLLAKYLIGLSQIVFGHDAVGARVAPALAGVVIVATLFGFGARIMGFWAGWAAAASWIALPREIRFVDMQFIALKLERHALLDVFAAAFGIVGLYLGWQWIQTRSWPRAVGTGVVIGLAAASKLVGVFFLPGILLVAVWSGRRDRRVLLQSVSVGVVSALTWLATYLSLGGRAVDAIHYMNSFQSQHATKGHSTWVAGHVYTHAPPWSMAWMQWDGDGPLLNSLFVLGVAAAFFFGRRLLATYLALAVLMPFAVLSASPVALPHYRYIWLPALTLLAALGWFGLLRQAGFRRVVGVACWATVAVVGTFTLQRAATVAPTDYRKVAVFLEQQQPQPVAVFVEGYAEDLSHSLPGLDIVTRSDFLAGNSVDVVIIDPIWTERHPDPAAAAEVARRDPSGPLTFDRLQVWVLSG
jgi:4-amino-4-deoxy-L-arabinose transferase-like glycosyltransferase